ncbi:MAG TPA: linear amide C-N hydrolase, partial [Chitinophagaceae bacterium]|nr:linear amide C-N hydrolase [Chitinophagaceae bacterium]
GLVVELMWLDETSYPKPDGRPAISVLQWIQYQLDNCASVGEVLATDKILRISGSGTPLHYLVADAAGNAATIEFLDGKLVAHTGKQLAFPVLTNSAYAESVQQAKEALRKQDVGEGRGSIERFTRACDMVGRYAPSVNGSLVDHSFRILDEVSQGDYTKWSIVYDMTNRSIYFKTNDARQVKTISFAAFDLSCGQLALALDMNLQRGGNVRALFGKFDEQMNRRFIERAADLSRGMVNIPAADRERLVRYPATTTCK